MPKSKLRQFIQFVKKKSNRKINALDAAQNSNFPYKYVSKNKHNMKNYLRKNNLRPCNISYTENLSQLNQIGNGIVNAGITGDYFTQDYNIVLFKDQGNQTLCILAGI